MKRVKVMLTAMIVLGTVGGVLAFKAKRAEQFCTRSTVNGVCPANAKCPNGLTLSKITQSAPGAILCYTTTDNASNCNSNTACSAVTRITAD